MPNESSCSLDFNPILTELWEGPKLKHQKCSKWICFCNILLLFLALFCQLNHKAVFKNYLTRFLRFLPKNNDKINGSDSEFKYFFQNEGLQFETWRLSQSIIKFSFYCYSHELYPILIVRDSFGSHELYPILIVRDSFGNLRTWGKGST